MKIATEAKKDAVDYLIKISTPTRTITSVDKEELKHKVFDLINKSEDVLGSGHAVLWHKNQRLVNAASNCGLQTPAVFSIVLRGNSCLGSDGFHKDLVGVSGSANAFVQHRLFV